MKKNKIIHFEALRNKTFDEARNMEKQDGHSYGRKEYR